MPSLTTDEVQSAARPGTTRRSLLLLCLCVVLARISYVPHPLRNDEGGYLLVARQWRTGGEFLYGDYFVDRPPLLMLIFRVASATGWDQAIRVLAIPFVLLFVLAGWRAGSLVAGQSGGRWAALVAAGLVCSPGLAAEQADGELFGAAFVMAAIALTLSAWFADPPARRSWSAYGAGACAVAAALVKQNLLEGVLLLAGLVVFACWRQEAAVRRRALALGSAALAGALSACLPVVLWLVAADIDLGTAWRDLVGFRGEAFDTIWGSSPDASIRRAGLLLVLGLVTGLFPVLVTWLVAARRRDDPSPVSRTVTLLLVFGVVAIVGGGSFWPPYLLQLAPTAVLAAGLVAPSASVSGAWMRASVRTVVAAAVLGTVVSLVLHATVPSAWSSQRIGEWLAESKSADDTGFVAYGLPSVLEAADMPSPYPYLWSVPMRTLDPDQAELRATLAGPRAPAWIVGVTGLNAWGIDEGGRLRDLLRERYRVVAEVCGHPVWLRAGLSRDLAPPPVC